MVFKQFRELEHCKAAIRSVLELLHHDVHLSLCYFGWAIHVFPVVSVNYLVYDFNIEEIIFVFCRKGAEDLMRRF